MSTSDIQEILPPAFDPSSNSYTVRVRRSVNPPIATLYMSSKEDRVKKYFDKLNAILTEAGAVIDLSSIEP
ncbi:MAG: hypothetical protein OXT74_11945 [Candidatus Poribacteria bacterium]|nr:hypothetical protein [Candidatus Poribacteria bacterium]